MNIKRGITRIYIVLSIVWAIFWLFIGIADNQIIPSIIGGVVTPIIIYFVALWIIKGFKE